MLLFTSKCDLHLFKVQCCFVYSSKRIDIKIAYHSNLKEKVNRKDVGLMTNTYLFKCYLAHLITYFAQ